MGYLVRSIDSKDSDILYALAEICQDSTGVRDNFELAEIFLAPTFPVGKKQVNKKVAFDMTIFVTDGKQSGQGKTGVELRYHKKHELLAIPK